jgi:hypothetical protein
MLPLLEALLHASPKVTSFHIIDRDAIDEENFLLKIRCELTSGDSTALARLPHAACGCDWGDWASRIIAIRVPTIRSTSLI